MSSSRSPALFLVQALSFIYNVKMVPSSVLSFKNKSPFWAFASILLYGNPRPKPLTLISYFPLDKRVQK